MTKHQPDAELKSFYREAHSWADDRQEQNARSRRAAWIIAGVATTIAAMEAIALAGLVPLKTVVPYTVLVDRQTGHVTTLDPSQPVQLAPDSALAKSMLAQYVTARESINRSTISSDYRKVMLWSNEAARSSYAALMKPGNPDNPLVRIPQLSTVEVRIKSVSLLEDGQALVRYDLVQRSGSDAQSSPAAFVSVIRFRFRDRPLVESDRFINPLGFEVSRYRRDPETAPAAAEPAASSSPGLNQQSPIVPPVAQGNNGARP
jgi:type IV secretion system protein VirB8